MKRFLMIVFFMTSMLGVPAFLGAQWIQTSGTERCSSQMIMVNFLIASHNHEMLIYIICL